jgi:hypothetical protein
VEAFIFQEPESPQSVCPIENIQKIIVLREEKKFESNPRTTSNLPIEFPSSIMHNSIKPNSPYSPIPKILTETGKSTVPPRAHRFKSNSKLIIWVRREERFSSDQLSFEE